MSVSFANTFIAKSQKQMPLAEATQNRSFGNYSWTTRLKYDFNRKSFCKFGSGKIEKCEKMIIIFSFLLVGGRGTLCTLAPQLPSYVARVYEKEDHGTTPVLFLIIKESWLLQRPWGGRGRESFAPLPSPGLCTTYLVILQWFYSHSPAQNFVNFANVS